LEAKVIDGKKHAENVLRKVREEVENLKRKGKTPHIETILIGNDPSSVIYVKRKQKVARDVGISTSITRLEESVREEELVRLIDKFNRDEDTDAILVQLPIPEHLNLERIIERISPDKDVDGFHPLNLGKLIRGVEEIVPCTPKGIIHLLEEEGVEIEGKKVVIVGRSVIVGRPLAILFLNRNATPTICHSKTRELGKLTKDADILVVAVGKPSFITSEMVKEGAIVIDVGISRTEDGKVVGDVDFDEVRKVASLITPVPGGVGPMTVAMLMRNTVELAKKL